MKRFAVCLFSLFLAVVVSSSASAQRYDLGSDVALKVEYFHFLDKDLQDLNAENGVYIGIEAYKQLFLPNLYFGMEIGWVGTSGDVNLGNQMTLSTDVDYVPIELNTKYVFPLSQFVNFDLGGGISMNYFDFSHKAPSLSISENDWVVGGQFFAGVNYTVERYFLGAEIKYQITDNLSLGRSSTDTSPDNLRVGMQAGMKF